MKFFTKAWIMLALVAVPVAFSFAPPRHTPFFKSVARVNTPRILPVNIFDRVERETCLFSATDNDETLQSSDIDLLEEEMAIVVDLATRAADDAALLQDLVAQALPTMHPRLIMKLRKAEKNKANDTAELTSVAEALGSVLDSRLAGGREVLATLLNAGEIRKLDAAIGKAARQGQLDMAFFTVLNMNIQETNMSAQEDSEGDASRSQILQHIYTRCQEEVEKMVPGGVALLNKLLRTEVDSIRANQLEHYLCPQPNVITTPDGKEITLEGAQPVLVPPPELVDALASAVQQIRTVEKAGGTDPVSAANMVESCRQIAREARMVIAKGYGVESDELNEFEEGLQPVFRPETPDSPYIRGQ